MPVVHGLLVSLATYGAVAWVAPGMFASGGGLVVVSVLAHAAGTAAALALDSDLPRNARPVFGVVTVASGCGLLMLVTMASTYAALAYAAPRLSPPPQGSSGAAEQGTSRPHLSADASTRDGTGSPGRSRWQFSLWRVPTCR